MLILLLVSYLHFSIDFYPTKKEYEQISQKIISKMKSFNICKKRYYVREALNPAYRTVSPYCFFFLYRLVSRRDGTVRYGTVLVPRTVSLSYRYNFGSTIGVEQTCRM